MKTLGANTIHPPSIPIAEGTNSQVDLWTRAGLRAATLKIAQTSNNKTRGGT